MKAILIDPYKLSVTQVEHNEDYRHINELIEAEHFDAAYMPNGDVIYVDDEGLLKGLNYLFAFKGYPNPLAGKGLILSADINGNSIPPKRNLSWYSDHVIWLERTVGPLFVVTHQNKKQLCHIDAFLRELMRE